MCVLLQLASAELLPYRPTCANPSSITNKPWNVTDYWADGNSFLLGSEWTGFIEVTHGTYNLCYINESILFIQYDWGNAEGNLFRDFEDIYSTNIGGQSNALKAKSGFTVHFEYYLPSDEGKCYSQDVVRVLDDGKVGLSYGWYPYQTGYSIQTVMFNNGDYLEEELPFADARYDLRNQSCDVWHTFEHSSWDFENEFIDKDRLVSFNFEFANAYVRNVWFSRGGVFYKLY